MKVIQRTALGPKCPLFLKICISANPYLYFSFCTFSYQWSTTVQKYYMENFRNKQFISFNLCFVLSGVMKSHPILLYSVPFQPGHESSVFPGYQCCICYPPAGHLVNSQLPNQLSWYHSASVQVTLNLLNNGTKAQQ